MNFSPLRAISRLLRAERKSFAGDPGSGSTFSGAGAGFVQDTYGRTPWKEWDIASAIKNGVKACSTVFACIDRLQKAGSTVPWKVMERKGEEWEPNEGHELELAIERPNDHMSRHFLKQVEIGFLAAGGNFLTHAVRVGQTARKPLGTVRDLWPLNPAVINYVPDPKRWLLGWETYDKKQSWPAEDVVHGQFVDLDNLHWGMSPIHAAAQVVTMDVAMVEWNERAVRKNSMVPSGAFILPEETGQPQRDEFADAIEEHYASPQNARKPLVLTAGQASWLRMSLTPAEMDWLASLEHAEKRICAVFGIIHTLLDPAGAGNLGGGKVLEEAVKFMWENGVANYLEAIQDAYNLRFIPRADRGKLWIHYDLSGVTALQDNLGKRLEAHERAVKTGVPPNRSFVMFDIPCPPQPGGDLARLPMTLEYMDPEEQARQALARTPAAFGGQAEGAGTAPGGPAAGEPASTDNLQEPDSSGTPVNAAEGPAN